MLKRSTVRRHPPELTAHSPQRKPGPARWEVLLTVAPSEVIKISSPPCSRVARGLRDSRACCVLTVTSTRNVLTPAAARPRRSPPCRHTLELVDSQDARAFWDTSTPGWGAEQSDLDASTRRWRSPRRRRWNALCPPLAAGVPGSHRLVAAGDAESAIVGSRSCRPRQSVRRQVEQLHPPPLELSTTF